MALLTRASLLLLEVREAIEADIAAMPPHHPAWTVDDHNRLLTKLFRDVWFRHGLAASRVPPQSLDDVYSMDGPSRSCSCP